ncbi:transforming growth factor-beta-induced protein ig-h3-like [Bacillus rossius redtenbacheri]|uniref:transforming growth factor-beta-induced protein ig-h3-like n=1 Tax=Bacillus rossius redtenbacheri TaxID=93214 RepID=UPI002FDDE530
MRVLAAVWALVVFAALTGASRHAKSLEDDLWSDLKTSLGRMGELVGAGGLHGDAVPFAPDVFDLDAAASRPDQAEPEPLDSDVEIVSADNRPALLPGGLFNLFNFGMRGSEPWWKGPNVCVEREEVDESLHKNDTSADEGGLFGSFQFSSCQQTDSKYICTTKLRNHGIRKSYVVKYQCCHGFRRVKGKPGCTEVQLKSMMETVEAVGAKDFARLLRSAGLEEKMASSNLTLFAPSDDALRDFTDSLQEANQVELFIPAARRRRSTADGSNMKEVLLSHMTPGFIDLMDLVDEEVLYSDNSNSTIRINMYPNRVVTANCARVTSPNNYASTGLVHVTDRVLRPATKTIAELITEDPQFASLASMVKKADLLEQLSGPGHFTLFAPTEEAFLKLDAEARAQIQNGHSCVANVVRHHLLPFTLCSAAVTRELAVRSLDDEVLRIDRRLDDGKLFVAGRQITVKDVVATNGIVHVLDGIVIPDSARSISDALDTRNLTVFAGLLREAGLADSLDGMGNVTVFAPTDAALQEPHAKRALERAREDKDQLRDLLLYHTAGPELAACDLANNMQLKSGLADRSLRVSLYSTLPFFSSLTSRITVQCARLLRQDTKACGGVIHAVDRLLLPPTQSVLYIVNTDEKFSTLSSIIKGSGLEAELRDTDPVTLLAPTDEVFARLDEQDLARLLEDKKLAKQMLRQHILPEAMCCSGVGASAWPFTANVETLSGKSIPARRDYEGRVHFGSTTVVDCDVMATNGILHTVNRVMLPQDARGNLGAIRFGGSPNLDIVLYGL